MKTSPTRSKMNVDHLSTVLGAVSIKEEEEEEEEATAEIKLLLALTT